MFQFPRFPPRKRGPGPSRPGGCPIRRSLDHRLPAPPQSISSRGHVLHRRPAPRHPPCAHHSGRPSVPRTFRFSTIQLASFPAGTTKSSPRGLLPTFPAGKGATARVGIAPAAELPGSIPVFPCRPARMVPDGHDKRPCSQLSTYRAGGAAGARTPNLRRARAALSQLSYDPNGSGRWAHLDSNQGPRPYQGRALTS